MSTRKVGAWTISYQPKPIPDRRHDYDFVHEDYDGAPDGSDHRCGQGESFEDCLEQIIELQDERIDELEDRQARLCEDLATICALLRASLNG